ncbi:unnamed protein product, partial [marine sediment metagenome]
MGLMAITWQEEVNHGTPGAQALALAAGWRGPWHGLTADLAEGPNVIGCKIKA